MTTLRIKRSDLKKGLAKLTLSTGETFEIVVERDGVTLVEFEDKLFRTDSAVVLPSLEGASEAADASTRQVSAVGLVAGCLRYLEEHPGHKILVAGHTDTAGNPTYNRTLSQKRAQTVFSVLTGDSLTFAEICKDVRYRVNRDYNQILTWLADTRGWDCRPNAIDDSGNALVVNRFRVEYNQRGPGSSWAPKITEWGDPNTTEVWQAYFNCYEEFLCEELGVTSDELAQLRQQIELFIDRGWVGCNEHHPRIAENLDEFPCDSNRRVELLFFDAKTAIAAPACATDPTACNAKACHLYDPASCGRLMLPPMVSAKPWAATWDPASQPIRSAETRQMVLTAPGLPAGQDVTIRLLQRMPDGREEIIDTIQHTSEVDLVQFPVSTWFAPETVKPATAGATALPKIGFRFEVLTGGRRKLSPVLPFGDALALQYVASDTGEPLAEMDYQLLSPWGILSGRTSTEGWVRVDELPPGGVRVVLGNQRLGES